MARARWTPGPIRLLVADPPCTPWSRAGLRRGHEDERDVLRETVDLVALLKPDAYLIGNVPGLDETGNLPVVRTTIGGLRQSGYCVRDFASLDAADYGVPQFRVRPYWFGHRAGPCLTWPERTHGDPKLLLPTLPGLGALRPWVTCRDALGHLPADEMGRPVHLRHEGKAAALLQGFPEGWCFLGASKAARWAQIGQAVPPPVAEALGRSIARWLRLQTPLAARAAAGDGR